jgi:GNAT superfamily N-acetyltransferase
VQPHARGQGIGRQLVHSLEAWAAPTYTVLRLRTDTPAAARFYEHLGYQPIADRAATHSRSLVDVRERSVEASPQLS